jgi:hypothetical protein
LHTVARIIDLVRIRVPRYGDELPAMLLTADEHAGESLLDVAGIPVVVVMEGSGLRRLHHTDRVYLHTEDAIPAARAGPRRRIGGVQLLDLTASNGISELPIQDLRLHGGLTNSSDRSGT